MWNTFSLLPPWPILANLSSNMLLTNFSITFPILYMHMRGCQTLAASYRSLYHHTSTATFVHQIRKKSRFSANSQTSLAIKWGYFSMQVLQQQVFGIGYVYNKVINTPSMISGPSIILLQPHVGRFHASLNFQSTFRQHEPSCVVCQNLKKICYGMYKVSDIFLDLRLLWFWCGPR